MLAAHPAVAHAAVVGLPHPLLGETPAAAVVLRAASGGGGGAGAGESEGGAGGVDSPEDQV